MWTGVMGSFMKWGGVRSGVSKANSKVYTIGGFVDELAVRGKAWGATAKGIYYFVESGKAAGSGRLSKGMAQCGVSWVKSVLTGYAFDYDGHKEKIDRTSRYTGPGIEMHRTDAYQEWVNRNSVFKEKGTVSYLTGAMASAYTAIKDGGGFSLGFHGGRTTKSYIPLSNPLRKSKSSIKISVYAEWQEFGTDAYPARPWVTGATLAWVKSFDKVWGNLLEDLLTDLYWEQLDSEPSYRTPGGESMTPDIAATPSVGSPSAMADNMAFSMKQLAALLGRSATGLHKSVQTALGGDTVFEGQALKLFRKGLEDGVSGRVLKGFEIDAIVHAIKHGLSMKELEKDYLN